MAGALGVKSLGLVGWKRGFLDLNESLGSLFAGDMGLHVSDTFLIDTPAGDGRETNLFATPDHSVALSGSLTISTS